MRYASCLLAVLILFQATPTPAQTRRAAAAHVKRGDLLMSRNKVDAALASYDKAVGADPAWASAYVKRGMARRAKGDLDGSIEDYEKAGGLDPRSTANNASVAESYNNRGMNRFSRLEVEGAVADFTKAIAHYGKDPNYFFRRGQALLVNEEMETAVGDFDRAAALNRGNEFLTTLIYVHRGYALLLQGKEGDARKEFDKCRQLKSGTQVQLQLYLLGIDAQIKERRRRRADSMKGVT